MPSTSPRQLGNGFGEKLWNEQGISASSAGSRTLFKSITAAIAGGEGLSYRGTSSCSVVGVMRAITVNRGSEG